MAAEIDTTNDHLVAVQGDSVVMLNPPGRRPMKPLDALRLAAHLAVMAEIAGHAPTSTADPKPAPLPTFDEVRAAIEDA